MKKYDAVVIGSGVAGLSAAYGLKAAENRCLSWKKTFGAELAQIEGVTRRKFY